MNKIIICESAWFKYIPLSMLNLNDFFIYFRRKRRYSIRHFQTQLLKKPLKEYGLKGIPNHVNELYEGNLGELKLKWRGLDTFFDWSTLKLIKASQPKHYT